METKFRSKFLKDVKKIKDASLKSKIKELIVHVEESESVLQLKNFKKLKGSDNAYRFKINEYRIGVHINGNTIEFDCFLHRKDIYKYFP